MAGPRIFVSSTAYDLAHLRGQLRTLIQQLGYEPVLSEYSDVLFDPRRDVQSSCLKELETCDIVVLIVGSRFGSEASPAALSLIDIDEVAERGGVRELTDGSHTLSVTQMELLRAVELEIPIFTFVEQAVLHDYNTFQANRASDIASEIKYGSISQPDRARYVFSFIDFLNGLSVNNAIEPFLRVEEIEQHLKRQWASLFQRLLTENRDDLRNDRGLGQVMSRLNDLQAAIVSTAEEGHARQVAQGTLNYRSLISVLSSLPVDLASATAEAIKWTELLARARIVKVYDVHAGAESTRKLSVVLLEMDDGSLWEARHTSPSLRREQRDWEAFVELPESVRMAILDVVSSNKSMPMQVRPSDNYIMTEIGPVDRRAYAEDPYADDEPF